MTFDEFVRVQLGPLTRFAGALTGDHALAEDVLSDALLKVAHRWRRISGMHNAGAYVRRIVVSTYLSDRRKHQRRRTEPAADLATLDRPSPDASAGVLDRDEVERLLATLPPRQRAAIVLRYLFDETDEEIAEALGCTTGTVRSHLSHARTALRLAATAQETAQERSETP